MISERLARRPAHDQLLQVGRYSLLRTQALADALTINATIKQIRLEGNGIGDAGTAAGDLD